MSDILSLLNERLGYETYEKPAEIINGFHLFFRNYIPAYNNDFLVGVALAWRSSDEVYACIARKSDPTVIRYQKGNLFSLEPHDSLPNGVDLVSGDDPVELLIALKDQAMEVLHCFVSKL